LANVADAAAALAGGRPVDAQEALGRAVAGGRAMGVVAFVPGWLADRACLAAHVGDEAVTEELIAEATSAGSRRGGLATATLGAATTMLAWQRGDLANAERLAPDATVSWHRAGAALDAADGVELLGTLACERGRWEHGVRLLAAAAAVCDSLGYGGPEQVLGAEACSGFAQDGAAMSLDEAVDDVHRRGGGRKRPESGWASLTPTERQVVQLVTEGLRNDAIAKRLNVTPGP
jgi:Bacterial regulatory proteins, luxR family